MTSLELEDLSFAYPTRAGASRQILSTINISLEEGHSVGLIGKNGAGKSTLMKLIVGLLSGYEGQIQVGDLKLGKKNLAKIRQDIGYVFQDSESQLFMSTVYEDVAFGPKNYGYDGEEVAKRTKEALDKVGLSQKAHRHIYKLSGGEKKLAAIATVLALEPHLLLLDEPSVGLDPQNRRRLIKTLNGLDTSKWIASHDLDLIYDTCDRVLLLGDGKIVADGSCKEILRDKGLLEANSLELPLSFSRQI